jgi:hypothetical protein
MDVAPFAPFGRINGKERLGPLFGCKRSQEFRGCFSDRLGRHASFLDWESPLIKFPSAVMPLKGSAAAASEFSR